jgi:lysophospholipase L1-like esterase
MNLRGERVLIFGDSLAHHGAMDAPEIWDVNLGATRSSGAPGDLLASLIRDQAAAAVRTNANVGRSAKNFWTAPNRRQTRPASVLLASDQAWRPTKVIIMLGTNDADIGAMDRASITKIRDAYEAMGAEVLAIGPPVFADARMTANTAKVYAVLQAAFPGKVIDARPLSATTGRAGDGVHFTAAGAKAFALKLLLAVQGLGTGASPGSGGTPPADEGAPPTPGTKGSGVVPALLTFVGLLGAGALGVRWWRRRQAAPLQGLSRQRLIGGKGDRATLAQFDPREVTMGRKVEREHTRDRAIIDEIVADHLVEDRRYYTKLARLDL